MDASISSPLIPQGMPEQISWHNYRTHEWLILPSAIDVDLSTFLENAAARCHPVINTPSALKPSQARLFSGTLCQDISASNVSTRETRKTGNKQLGAVAQAVIFSSAKHRRAVRLLIFRLNLKSNRMTYLWRCRNIYIWAALSWRWCFGNSPSFQLHSF
jgi:hypothetical protein